VRIRLCNACSHSGGHLVRQRFIRLLLCCCFFFIWLLSLFSSSLPFLFSPIINSARIHRTDLYTKFDSLRYPRSWQARVLNRNVFSIRFHVLFVFLDKPNNFWLLRCGGESVSGCFRIYPQCTSYTYLSYCLFVSKKGKVNINNLKMPLITFFLMLQWRPFEFECSKQTDCYRPSVSPSSTFTCVHDFPSRKKAHKVQMQQTHTHK
jgi:hypothetical protein